MKKTKEIKSEENSVEKILKFESIEDAEAFEYVAKGRKFCKKGERIQDICEDELENCICRNSGNIILKIYLHHKLKKRKGKLESRITSVIRNLALEILDEEDCENLSEKELAKKVKEIILEEVEKYKKQYETKGKSGK
ncbi:MAG: hypothetical protein ACI4VC_03495 [Clostridia bacterium]